jgi:hypothetical protein
VGGEIFDLSTKVITFGGRFLVIGFASGKIPSIQANRILLKKHFDRRHWAHTERTILRRSAKPTPSCLRSTRRARSDPWSRRFARSPRRPLL